MSARDVDPPESVLATTAGVRRLARALTRDLHGAEDLAQDAWLRALQRQPWKHGDDLRPWFARVVRNLAHLARRGEARRREHESLAARSEAQPSSAAIVERAELHRALFAEVIALREPFREALILRYLEGRPPRAIAQQLQLPVSTVNARLARGLALLRERFGESPDGRGRLLALAALARLPVARRVLQGGLWMALESKRTSAVVALAALCLSLLAIRGVWILTQSADVAGSPLEIDAVRVEQARADEPHGRSVVVAPSTASAPSAEANQGDPVRELSGPVPPEGSPKNEVEPPDIQPPAPQVQADGRNNMAVNRRLTVFGARRGDQFGASIAAAGDVDGDGLPDPIVGAPQPGKEQPGYVALFSGRDGRLIRKLVGRNPGDFLGIAVDGGKDVDGDGRPDCAVSALNWRGEMEAGLSGVVVVFSGADGHPIHELAAPAGADVFGHAVLLLGDVDGDGKSEIAVASPESDNYSDSGPGKVLVYSGAIGSVLYELTELHDRDSFAQSIALAGDLDNDGVEDFVVGAPRGTAPGALEGYVRAVSGKTGETIFLIQGEVIDEDFGWVVAGGFDLDRDGRPDLAVGSSRGLVGSSHANRHPVDCLRVISSATHSTLLKIPAELWVFHPGTSVAFAGDLDRDGTGELLVGDPLAKSAPLRIYDSSGAWRPVVGIPRPEVGMKVCVLGDVDEDGSNDFAVGCHGAPSGPDGAAAGAVTVFSGRRLGPIYTLRGEVAPAPNAR